MVAGFVTALLLALAAYIYWASPAVGKRNRPYDIVFEKSVAGLFENSIVSLQGVAVGKVGRIRFDPYNPEHVQVRIHITNPDAPILEGTTASIDRDLFGTALISLASGPAGSPPIRSVRWNVVPVIPAKEGGLSLEDPVSVVENISNTADKLNRFLTPANQRSISDQIARMERRSSELAARTPQLAATIASTRSSLRSGAAMAEAMDKQLATMDKKMQDSRGSTAAFRESMRSARESMAQLDAKLEAARPMVAKLSNSGLQEQVSAMRQSADELSRSVSQVDQAGAGALMSKPAVPDYKPGQ